jgi:hypothetical protein
MVVDLVALVVVVVLCNGVVRVVVLDTAHGSCPFRNINADPSPLYFAHAPVSACSDFENRLYG